VLQLASSLQITRYLVQIYVNEHLLFMTPVHLFGIDRLNWIDAVQLHVLLGLCKGNIYIMLVPTGKVLVFLRV
jgi:hypothetical protein